MSPEEWCVFSYRRDFGFLWGVGSNSGSSFLSSLDRKTSVVLVWDGMPSDKAESTPVNVEDRVTAYDWLAFLVIALSTRPTTIRIILFDLCGETHSASFGCRLFPLLLPLLPWISVYNLNPAHFERQTVIPMPE
jgi:hypothetical protein